MWVFLGILFFYFHSAIAADAGGQENTKHFHSLPSQVFFDQPIKIRVQSQPFIRDEKWSLYLRQNETDKGRLQFVTQNTNPLNLNFTIPDIDIGNGNNLTLLAISDGTIIGSSDSFNCSRQSTSQTSLTGTSTSASTTLLETSISTQSEQSSLSTTASGVATTPVLDFPPVAMVHDSAMQQSSRSRLPLIVGLTIGCFAFVIASLLVFLLIRRRRRLANEVPRHITFNRELMFERRPSTYDVWSLRSAELEKAAGAPKVYITKMTTSDRNV